MDIKFTLRKVGSREAVETRPFRLSEKCDEDGGVPVMRFLELAELPQGAYVLEARVEDRLKRSSISEAALLTLKP